MADDVDEAKHRLAVRAESLQAEGEQDREEQDLEDFTGRKAPTTVDGMISIRNPIVLWSFAFVV